MAQIDCEKWHMCVYGEAHRARYDVHICILWHYLKAVHLVDLVQMPSRHTAHKAFRLLPMAIQLFGFVGFGLICTQKRHSNAKSFIALFVLIGIRKAGGVAFSTGRTAIRGAEIEMALTEGCRRMINIM